MSQLIPARRRLLASVALVACTFAVYAQVGGHAFINFDDPLYVTENAEVRRGVTIDGIAWAFTTGATGNWHPLTWLSHMLDVSVAGLDPRWHHLMNVALHATNALVLLLLLERMTGALWPSALTASLFALHPLHVESVAWVAERKDVLSTLFGLLAVAAYVRWARAPSRSRYLHVVLCFALSLMAKPTLVTLPVVLLLLDYWPLDRRLVRARLVEKIPLFILALASGIVTLFAQQRRGTVSGLDAVPLGYRIGHAIASYAHYLSQALWPANLAVFYPYPHQSEWAYVAGAAALLIALSGITLWFARSSPFLVVGWGWYLVTLLPMIGVVQVGMQSTADRYMYVPLIGLGIALSWSLDALARRTRVARAASVGFALLAVAGCMTVTARQLSYWRDDLALYRHALDVTSDNFLAHNNLGLAIVTRNRADAAAAQAHFAQAVRLRPGYADAHNNLGGVLYLQGRRAEAIAHFTEALRLRPDFAAARDNLRIANTPVP